MNNVLVIGAGKRTLGAVLPALHCMPDRFRVAGVVARSVKQVSYGLGTVTTRDSLDGIDWKAIDLVITAVSISQVPRMLASLARRDVGHAVLLHDTPVLPPSGLPAARHFAAFRRAYISEDNIALPPLLLAKQLIDDGAIGQLKKIYFFHNGYKHHALASLKLLTGSTIERIVSRKFAGKLRQKTIDFASGVTALMYEPRDYATGRFLIEGDRGSIADYDYANGSVRRIGYVVDGDVYRGLTLDGAPVPPAGLDADYLARIGPGIPEASPMNTMKLRGLMDLIVGALDDRSPFHYTPEDGIADHLAIRIVDRVGYVPAQRTLARLVPLAKRVPFVQRAL